ncbi:LysR family transcriptional regulator [Haliea sp.]|uniref:LysR family transcriptional regulator n=1 Tax=Haliea sp. TaxID=1932666 RepID=UPI0035270953
MHPIDTRQLRHVLMLAKHRSFRKAADALFITQPALTKSIKNLEQQLDVMLFDRKSQSVDPTPHCEVLMEHAQRIMHELDDIHHSLDALSDSLRGELRVGSGPIVARGPIGDAVARLVSRHPGLSIRVTIDSWAGLVQQLHAGALHLMVADIGEFEGQADLEVVPLNPIRSIAVCRPGHPLLQVGRVQATDLTSYPLALPSLPRRWVEWLRANAPAGADPDGFVAQACRIYCEDFSLLSKVVLHSDFITCGPERILRDNVVGGQLVEIDFPGFSDILVRPGIVYLRNTTLPPAGRVLIEQLLSGEAEPGAPAH